MKIDATPSRRSLLIAGAATAGVAVVAACSRSSGDSAGSRAPADNSSNSVGGSSARRTSGPSPSGYGAASTAAPSADSLIALAAIPVGSSKPAVLTNGDPVLITRTATDAVVCFSATCTHQACTVSPDGDRFRCPCHGSEYNARTGAVLNGPAPKPLPKIAVHLVAGEVVTD